MITFEATYVSVTTLNNVTDPNIINTMNNGFPVTILNIKIVM